MRCYLIEALRAADPSFGSYHLAVYDDAVNTGQQMGHRSSDVIHNHYKALVLKTEAERFWNLKPKTQQEVKKEFWAPPSEVQKPGSH